ncbi:DUF2489 domain-containing protein [Kangiella shandongensis]|uniref:DUF2489 domain-containing protein n=1 Tax=Kangiella shandongensis TaxID=2763258 RepID=UPI001CC0BCE1|nr:DUF2489 domain-containing protein [Kangiella shandongensis]
MTIFYYIASFITLCLAVYATYLLVKLRQQKRIVKSAESDFAIKQQAQLNSVIESIVTIAKGMQQGQCPTIEGCIRLKVLIDQLRLDEDSRKPFAIFYTIYDKTEHIPTHQAWVELEKRQKMAFTRDMMLLESEYQEEIDKAVEHAVEHFKEVEKKSKFDLGKAI